MRTRGTVAALVALSCLLGTTAFADTRTKIASAQQQLHDLEAQISTEQAGLAALHSSLRDAIVAVARSRELYDAIQAQLLESRKETADVQTKYDAIRAQIDKLGVAAYVGGPGATFQSLDPLSLRDASDLLQYVSSIVAHNATLAEEARQLQNTLTERSTQEAVVMSHRAAALTQMTADQDALMQRLAEEQIRLVQLAQARAQVSALLVHLRAQLRAEEIAAAEAALAHGITFGKWATAFLGHIDAPIARNNLVVIVAWETAEWTSARWNPLATTYYMPGSTCYNRGCVRNYLNLQQGLDATYKTLSRPGLGYEPILNDLAHNADPMDTAKAINASSWCGGCSDGEYVVDLVPSVEQHYDYYANASAN